MRDKRFKKTRDLFKGKSGPYSSRLADLNTPPIARKWLFRMNMNMDSDFAKVVERAWSDDAYKARLLGDANAVLAEAGISIPEGIKVKVVENTESLAHVILPPKPAEETFEESDGNCCGSCAG